MMDCLWLLPSRDPVGPQALAYLVYCGAIGTCLPCLLDKPSLVVVTVAHTSLMIGGEIKCRDKSSNKNVLFLSGCGLGRPSNESLMHILAHYHYQHLSY